MEKVLISGASGLIGSALAKNLRNKGFQVSRLVRAKPTSGKSEIFWDPIARKLELSPLEGFTTIIHLAGKNIVSGRWNQRLREEIRNSRIKSTKLLCESLVQLSYPPKLIISASAIGYYGTEGNKEFDEGCKPGTGFLADICVNWEAETQIAINQGIRVIHLRLGMVLSTRGGALSLMLPAFKMGVAGVLGDGRQYISWITLDDVIGVINFIINNDSIRGPVNTVAPNPVTNREFTKTLGRILRRPTVFAVPRFVLRLALGEMANETLLASCKAFPKKLKDNGYKFQQAYLEEALKTLVKGGSE